VSSAVVVVVVVANSVVAGGGAQLLPTFCAVGKFSEDFLLVR